MSDAGDYSRKKEKHIYRLKRDLERILPEFLVWMAERKMEEKHDQPLPALDRESLSNKTYTYIKITVQYTT